jgi:hypothetical protein
MSSCLHRSREHLDSVQEALEQHHHGPVMLRHREEQGRTHRVCRVVPGIPWGPGVSVTKYNFFGKKKRKNVPSTRPTPPGSASAASCSNSSRASRLSSSRISIGIGTACGSALGRIRNADAATATRGRRTPGRAHAVRPPRRGSNACRSLSPWRRRSRTLNCRRPTRLRPTARLPLPATISARRRLLLRSRFTIHWHCVRCQRRLRHSGHCRQV